MKNLSIWCVRLRQLRKAKGLKQPELAKLSGVSQGQISLLETNKRPFTQETLDKLLKPLCADYEDIFVTSKKPQQTVINMDYKKWNDNLQELRNLEKAHKKLKIKLKEQKEIIDYAKKYCEKINCPILQRLA